MSKAKAVAAGERGLTIKINTPASGPGGGGARLRTVVAVFDDNDTLLTVASRGGDQNVGAKYPAPHVPLR